MEILTNFLTICKIVNVVFTVSYTCARFCMTSRTGLVNPEFILRSVFMERIREKVVAICISFLDRMIATSERKVINRCLALLCKDDKYDLFFAKNLDDDTFVKISSFKKNLCDKGESENES